MSFATTVGPALLGVAAVCCAAGCRDAGPGVVGAEEIGVLSQSALVVGRDGGQSGLVWGRSAWTYGDTVLSSADEDGLTWHHNSFDLTSDLVARDGIDGFETPLDSAGAPVHFVAPTAEERAFNLAHAGDPCAEPPCGARWAAWPGAPLFDAVRDRALVFYGLIYAEPGDFNFRGVGQSLAVWTDPQGVPERPVVSPGSARPTLLFGEGEPGWGAAAAIADDALFALACDTSGLSKPCKLARAPLEAVLDRAAWRYWNGDDWTDDPSAASVIFDGAPIVSLAWNAHLGSWLAVYAPPFSSDVVARKAPELTGPWSRESVLFTASSARDPYDAVRHAEYDEDGGRVFYVTYSRPTSGWFGAELALVRVELE